MTKIDYSIIDKCDKTFVLALKDALNVVNGKWKLAVVCVLFSGKKRFSEIERTIEDITPRMVSKELKELEENGVVRRNVIASIPVVIEYELTASGQRLHEVVLKMVAWGKQHREEILADDAAVSMKTSSGH